MTELYRLIVRNSQGEVEDKIECLSSRILSAMHEALNQGFSVTVVKLEKNREMRRLETCGTSGRREAHPPPKSLV